MDVAESDGSKRDHVERVNLQSKENVLNDFGIGSETQQSCILCVVSELAGYLYLIAEHVIASAQRPHCKLKPSRFVAEQV
jgi:hypothetical protein